MVQNIDQEEVLMKKLYLLLPVVLLMAVGQTAWAAKPKPKPRLVKVVGRAMLDKKPMAGAVVVLAGVNVRKRVKAELDKNGRFTARLVPGVYRATVRWRGKSYHYETGFESGFHIGFYPVQHLSLWFWTKDKKQGGGQ